MAEWEHYFRQPPFWDILIPPPPLPFRIPFPAIPFNINDQFQSVTSPDLPVGSLEVLPRACGLSAREAISCIAPDQGRGGSGVACPASGGLARATNR